MMNFIIFILSFIGALTLIFIYYLLGHIYNVYEIDNKWSMYWWFYHHKFMSLMKQYPDHYKYEDGKYWYNMFGKIGVRASTDDSPEMKEYMENIDIFIVIFWPIFMIITFIRKFYDKSRKKMAR